LGLRRLLEWEAISDATSINLKRLKKKEVSSGTILRWVEEDRGIWLA
jgi:hypothetical protein